MCVRGRPGLSLFGNDGWSYWKPTFKFHESECPSVVFLENGYRLMKSWISASFQWNKRVFFTWGSQSLISKILFLFCKKPFRNLYWKSLGCLLLLPELLSIQITIGVGSKEITMLYHIFYPSISKFLIVN